MYFYRGVCKKTAQNSIFRLMFYRPLSKNSIFLWEMFFFLNMSAKNREKIQPLGHFFGLARGKIVILHGSVEKSK